MEQKAVLHVCAMNTEILKDAVTLISITATVTAKGFVRELPRLWHSIIAAVVNEGLVVVGNFLEKNF